MTAREAGEAAPAAAGGTLVVYDDYRGSVTGEASGGAGGSTAVTADRRRAAGAPSGLRDPLRAM